MTKSFQEAFREWASDNRYEIAEDCGTEWFDALESAPTAVTRSSTTKGNGPTHSTQAFISRGKEA